MLCSVRNEGDLEMDAGLEILLLNKIQTKKQKPPGKETHSKTESRKREKDKHNTNKRTEPKV